MDDRHFHMVLDRHGLSREGYHRVRKGVKKRIRSHMQALGCKTTAAYLDLLERDRRIQKKCERLLTVSISRLFRDQPLWLALENRILPEIARRHQTGIKIWSAGCACGEEVYSLKIIVTRLRRRIFFPEVQITATDMTPEYVRRARSGRFTLSSLREVPDAYRRIFFDADRKGRWFRIKPELALGIQWLIHDLLDDPPDSGFNIVFLRNSLFTYYQDSTRQKVLAKIVHSLAGDGILVIGLKERLPDPSGALVCLEDLPFIFQKRS